jgi:hypothetical protein
MDEVLVKTTFIFPEEGIKHDATFPSSATGLLLKERLGADLNVPVNRLLLQYNNTNVEDGFVLNSLGPFSDVPEITFAVLTSHEEHAEEHSRGADLIQVNIYDSAGNIAKTVAVHIDRSELKHSYIGGYRNKKTGAEFHHAATQTKSDQKANTKVQYEHVPPPLSPLYTD